MIDFLPFSIKNCDVTFTHISNNTKSFFSQTTRDNKGRAPVLSLSNNIEVPSCTK